MLALLLWLTGTCSARRARHDQRFLKLRRVTLCRSLVVSFLARRMRVCMPIQVQHGSNRGGLDDLRVELSRHSQQFLFCKTLFIKCRNHYQQRMAPRDQHHATG